MDHIFDENQPIYLQIKKRICAAILRGDYQPGGKLPAIIETSMQFKVNHNTIQRVYVELIREGIAISKRGEGTFVTRDVKILARLKVDMQNQLLTDFIQEMTQLGYKEKELADILKQHIQSEQNSKRRD